MIPVYALIFFPDRFGATSFPYGSPTFESFVRESYRVAGKPSPNSFFKWFENATHEAGWHDSVSQTAHAFRAKWKAAEPARRPDLERGFAAEVHRMIKKAIPHFSLERGFEFTNTVQYGERQCYLQSVVVTGILQKAGLDAGVAMVWANEAGRESNNGHATSVLRLSNGREVLVDCSEPHAFATHKGLFLSVSDGYRFAVAKYDRSANLIQFSSPAGVNLPKVHGLAMNFLRSQFDFYRGERAPGGFLAASKTESGLARSASFLSKAVRECPQNLLAVYVLGHVLRRQGNAFAAKQKFETALHLYEAAGHVPTSVFDAAKG